MTISYKDLDPKVGANNILELLELATDQEIQDGISWYQRANKFCQTLADNYDLSLASVAGIVASLSPGCNWDQNMIDTVNLLALGENATVTTYNRNKFKALAILQGIQDPYDALSHGKLGQDKKTFCFWLNIINPRVNGRVTIDRHASRIAWDRNINADQGIFYSNTPKKYIACENAYREASKNVGILPHQLQAITWITYRRLYVTRRKQKQEIKF